MPLRALAALLLIALPLALPVLVPTAAYAKPSPGEEKFLEAVAAHKAGKLKLAIKALQAAAKADPHPTLLFNLAVISDGVGDVKSAGRYYQEYLDTAPVDEFVILLRYRQIAPKQAEAWAKAKEAGAKKDAGKAVADKGDTKKGEKGKEAKEGGATPAGASNVLSYSLLGAGGLALAVGAVFGAMTVTDVNEFMDSRVRSEAQRHADDAKSHQLLANVSFITGLLALGGGVALLLMSDPGSGGGGDVEGATPLITPLVGPDSGGGLLTFEF